MSRGFVKEGDQEEPVVIPPRAALPDGATNYVTPQGLQQMMDEKEELLKERAEVSGSETEIRRTHTLLDGKLALLKERITSARVIDPSDQPEDEVRFGATVTYLLKNSKQPVTITIVGVDEADVKKKKIAFVAPIAKALSGAKVGEEVTFQLGNEARTLTVKNIEYRS
ncbi:GreA/GreB family elongation factor [Luteirhabdus pelagi]|uniref:GreA/GreB family elongation factor n=1 Tax=Luteirhabdus pelagi TaxID=2792783 RepID=UPI00193A1699|nr:GreA/GreB family elongation factor [Luteirhabdus pelagi]